VNELLRNRVEARGKQFPEFCVSREPFKRLESHKTGTTQVAQ